MLCGKHAKTYAFAFGPFLGAPLALLALGADAGGRICLGKASQEKTQA